MDNNETVTKIAFASALFAGFAYFSLSILRDTFKSKKAEKANKKNAQKTTISSQTELTFPIGTREKSSAWSKIPPELWAPWAKSIQERIRELNLCKIINNSNGFTYDRKAITPGVSLQCTPKHTPRSLSPIANNSFGNKNLSKSEESLYSSSKQLNCSKQQLISSRSNLGINRVLKVPTDVEIKMYTKILMKLKETSCSSLSQQEASVLTMLLLSNDSELLVNTLSVIGNCAAFTMNIDQICDSGCLLILQELLDHTNNAVQVAATQAFANLALSERVQDIAQPMIAPLIDNLLNSRNDLHLSLTLMALANMAMKDSNHNYMIKSFSFLANLISTGSPNVRLQAIKLLVNLSCNVEMIPYLLAMKYPSNIYTLIDEKTDGDLLLRLLTFLANVIDISVNRDMKADHLPSEYKAPSPETVYSAIYGNDNKELLIKRLNHLNSTTHEEIKYKVTQILRRLQN